MLPSENSSKELCRGVEKVYLQLRNSENLLVTQTKYEMNPRQFMKPGGSSNQGKGTLVPCNSCSAVNRAENWLHIFIEYSSICFLIWWGFFLFLPGKAEGKEG